MEQAQGPGLPGRDPGAGLPDRRIEAVHERDSRDERRSRGLGRQFPRVLHAGRQGLLAHHRLARPKGQLGKGGMERVGCADVHDVDVVSGDQRLGGVHRPFGAKLGGGGRGPLRRGSRHTGDHPASGRERPWRAPGP